MEQVLDCGIEKTGDNHIIKFILEALNEEFYQKKKNSRKNA